MTYHLGGGVGPPSRVMVTGSRSIDQASETGKRLRLYLWAYTNRSPGVVLVSGACPSGADQVAESWAGDQEVQVERHPADWSQFGKRAGFLRNATMVASLDPTRDLVIAAWDGESRGTMHSVRLARKAGVRVVDAGVPTDGQ